MNPTYKILRKYAKRKSTQKLVDTMDAIFNDTDHGTILAALVQTIVAIHIEVSVEEFSEGGKKTCLPCTNASLTELLQTVRRVHDDAFESVPHVNRHRKK